MCGVLDVSRCGFYAWLKRNQSDREKENTELTEVIQKDPRGSQGPSGIDRLVAELAKLGRHSPGVSVASPAPQA
jgi:putative transposase